MYVQNTPAASLPKLLAIAEERCLQRGSRLTSQRRAVLEALIGAEKPCGAYDLIERVASDGRRRPAPVAIYRALEFLMAHGLVHRLESRNAFVACPHAHDAKDGVVFLICENCQTVAEATSTRITADVADLALSNGFRLHGQTIELTGLCGPCAANTNVSKG